MQSIFGVSEKYNGFAKDFGFGKLWVVWMLYKYKLFLASKQLVSKQALSRNPLKIYS
jgi:hypothetical protein